MKVKPNSDFMMKQKMEQGSLPYSIFLLIIVAYFLYLLYLLSCLLELLTAL